MLKIRWNPSRDSSVLFPFWELYALTHAIQRNDTCGCKEKQVSDCLRAERASAKCQTLKNMTPALTSASSLSRILAGFLRIGSSPRDACDASTLEAHEQCKQGSPKGPLRRSSFALTFSDRKLRNGIGRSSFQR
jgi:hypothetical protein